MSSRLIDTLATTDALSEVFSDRSLLQAMLDVEGALAKVEADLGMIPKRAADAIQSAACSDSFDASAIAKGARESGTPTIPLVKALTDRVQAADAESARFVHWGATSQDVSDSAFAVVLSRARPAIAADHDRLVRTLRDLSDRHAETVMLARTLLQPAPPITFGLKVAGWVAALERGWTRVNDAFDGARVVQCGGASGTLAAFGANGIHVAQSLADELDLLLPDAPWHTHRDRLAALVASLGIYTATLGKIARDISLLMQAEVGEVSEPGGGSSSMPHKKNPAGSAIALAAATRMPSLVSAFLSGMVQEHERSAGGWHAEWPTLASVVQTAGAAVQSLATAAAALTVDPDRMRSNIDSTRGAIFAERAMTLMAGTLGKETAQAIVGKALARTREEGIGFREALAAIPEAANALAGDELRTLDVPEAYLGSAETLRRRLLSK
ncbi:MAG TPA: 3-carboxy-cis,cis-muconate cycloisomerase [Vicinamibacterales bacterium]|jgi:3-carboxy-cis,cis-muconate cycloisomerase